MVRLNHATTNGDLIRIVEVPHDGGSGIIIGIAVRTIVVVALADFRPIPFEGPTIMEVCITIHIDDNGSVDIAIVPVLVLIRTDNRDVLELKSSSAEAVTAQI